MENSPAFGFIIFIFFPFFRFPVKHTQFFFWLQKANKKEKEQTKQTKLKTETIPEGKKHPWPCKFFYTNI